MRRVVTFPNRFFAVVAAASMCAGSFALSAATANASGYIPPSETVYIETDCSGEVWLKANVGDTVVITMKHPGCNGDPADTNQGNYANLNNLNGTFFTDVEYDVDNDPQTPDVAPYQGTATGSGYLEYVSHTEGTNKGNDYWNNPSRGSQDDWFVMQTVTGGNDVAVTTRLLGADGNGAPLRGGVTVGDIYTEPVFYEPVEFPIRWAGPRDGSNISTPPSLPDGQSLFAVSYNLSTAGEIDTQTGQFAPYDNPVGADAGGTEGGGYDPVTRTTWIMQDCDLFELNGDGSADLHFRVPTVNSSPLRDCWGFTTLGDGTAYISGRTVADDPESNTLFRLSLSTGSFIGSGVPLFFEASNVDPSTSQRIDPWKLEPTELAFNTENGALWVAGYEGYIYQLNPATGRITNIYSGLVASGQWTWGMAVDGNNVLWMSVGDANTWTELVTLQPDNNWARYHFTNAVFTGTNTPFDSDAMWITGQAIRSAQLANTGTNSTLVVGFSGASVLVGALAIAVGLRVRGSKQRRHLI